MAGVLPAPTRIWRWAPKVVLAIGVISTVLTGGDQSVKDMPTNWSTWITHTLSEFDTERMEPFEYEEPNFGGYGAADIPPSTIGNGTSIAFNFLSLP
jgi:hypothetical protein